MYTKRSYLPSRVTVALRDDRKSIKPKQEVVLCTDQCGLVPLIISVHVRGRERERERETEREIEKEREKERESEREREEIWIWFVRVPVCSAQAGREDAHAPAGRPTCIDTP